MKANKIKFICKRKVRLVPVIKYINTVIKLIKTFYYIIIAYKQAAGGKK